MGRPTGLTTGRRQTLQLFGTFPATGRRPSGTRGSRTPDLRMISRDGNLLIYAVPWSVRSKKEYCCREVETGDRTRRQATCGIIKKGSVDLGYHTSCHTRYALGTHTHQHKETPHHTQTAPQGAHGIIYDMTERSVSLSFCETSCTMYLT